MIKEKSADRRLFLREVSEKLTKPMILDRMPSSQAIQEKSLLIVL